MSDDLDFYALLGIGRDASEDEIRNAFRSQVREYHPDLNDDPRASAQFTALKKAYDTLADPKERDVYDRIGHDEYVKNRISGLPSASQWEVPDEEGDEDEEIRIFGPTSDTTTTSETTGPGTGGDESSADGTTDQGPTAGTGTSSTATAGSAASDRSASTGPEESASGTGSTPGAGSASGAGSVSGSGSSAGVGSAPGAGSVPGGGSSPGVGASGSTSGTGSSGTGSSPGGFGPGPGSVDGDGGSRESISVSPTSTRSTATGVGTARGPKSTPAPGSPDPSTPDVEASETDESPESRRSLPSITDLLQRWLRRLVGWPMILYANAVYLVGVSLYAAANAAGIGILLQQLRAVGTDPDAVLAVFESRHGIQSAPAYLLSDLSGTTPGGSILPATPPLGAILFVAGAACLPTVYFFLVRWTRGGGRNWQPTYLYVVGAATPAVGLVVSVATPSPLLYVDLSLFVLVPVGTMVTMLYFGRVNPRVKRAIRRWRYRG